MASDDKRQTIKRGDNTVGTRYALVHNQTTDTYEVWVRKANYNGRVRGCIEYRWAYVEMKMDKPTADALYKRKLGGKAR